MMLDGFFLFTIYDEVSVDHSREILQVIDRCLDQYRHRLELDEPPYPRTVVFGILKDHTGRSNSTRLEDERFPRGADGCQIRV